jgi:hypothetical protein
MQIIAMAQEVQIPLLATLLLGGCAAKLARAFRAGSLDAGLGPTALFPIRLRRPVALAMSAVELGLGIGLIATAGAFGLGAPAACVRLGTALLFVVAVCALLELRTVRPEVGCGCFGELSTSPVDWRTLTRPALLALAALGTLGLSAVHQPSSSWQAAGMLGMLAAELVLIACLSPELGEALVRLGYSEPCELRVLPAERTLTALRRSKQWRRHAGLLTADLPVDMWRELCWRYLVFPGRYGDREAEVVFGVFLRQRRPLIRVALIDATTGRALNWPSAPARSPWRGPSFLRHVVAASPAAGQPALAAPGGRPADPREIAGLALPAGQEHLHSGQEHPAAERSAALY